MRTQAFPLAPHLTMRRPGVVVDARTRKGVRLSTVSRRDYPCPMPVTVALADDNLIVREGIAQLLAGQPDIEVVASCDDLDSLLAAIDEHGPNVVVTDIRMPPTHTDEGIRLAALLRESHPNVGVVVLSNYAEAGFAMALLESGSEGRAYLLKERVHSRTQLASAIHSVAAGGSVMDPKIVEPLVTAKSRSERSPLSQLTAREREVLSEIAQGKSNAAIAESLVLTKRAVEKHINSIFLKLNLSDIEDVSKRVKATLMFLSDADVSRV
jgi:DNA-binding NarL/FixJ family response regulator